MGEKMDEKKVITAVGHVYETIKKLGEGFAGQVFLVKEQGRDEPLALKLLNPEAYKEGQLESFKREFSVLSDLHHPHLCRVFDFGFSDSEQKHFFSSEFIEGTELYKCTDALSIEEIEEIFVQIADGLGAIHAAGLIHFDIKGANTLVAKVKGKSFPKIVDFGLATPAVEAPKFIAGTVRYISPEMITKSEVIDYRADLYSLGIMFYRMLAKRYPNQGSTMEEVLKWHVKHQLIDEEPLKRARVPRYLMDVIQKLTNPIPTNRFSSANVLIKFIELHSGRSYQLTRREQLTSLIEEGPLVGRDDLMHKLKLSIGSLSKKKMPEGNRQIVALAGPPGIGKSRIIKETKYIAQLGELSVVAIRAEEEGQNIDKWKKTLAVDEDEYPFDLVVITKRFGPLCLMVDDFDKCSPSVRQAILGLMSHLYSMQLAGTGQVMLLILTLTTGTEDEPISVPVDLGVDAIRLGALRKEDVLQYVKQFLGDPNPSANQVDEIFSYSGGIPELMRVAIAGLEGKGSKQALDVNRIFTDRINKLSPPSRALLGVLSLAEKPIRQETIEGIMESATAKELAELARSGLVVFDRATNGYCTATGAISRSIAKLFPKKELVEASARFFKYTTEHNAEDWDALVKFAEFCKTGDELAGILLEAAKAKELKGEVDHAQDYYQRFLKIVSPSDERRTQILRSLAKSSILTGNLDNAENYLNEATASKTMTMEDHISLSWIYRLRNNPKEALGHIEEALNLLDSAKQMAEKLRLMNEKAECHMQMGDFENAEKLFRSSLEEAKGLPKEILSKVPNNNLGMALACRGQTDEAISFYKQKYETFSGDKRTASSVLSRLGYIYQQADQLDEAYEAYKQSLDLAMDTGDIHNITIILGNLICICQSKSLFSDALKYANESLKQSTRALSTKQLGQCFLTIGGLHIHLGLEDIADRYLGEALKIFQKIGDNVLESWVYLSFAFLHRNVGDHPTAIANLETVIGKARELKITQLYELGCLDIADLFIDMEEFEKAREHINQIEHPWPGKEKARELDIQVELVRCKLATLGGGSVDDCTLQRIDELKVLAEKKGLRELASEVYYLLQKIYEQRGDKEKSLNAITRAKAIIDDIALTLSEEYRDSYMKQLLRKDISDVSLKLTDSSVLGAIIVEEKKEIKPEAQQEDNFGATANLSKESLEVTRNLKK